jgi:hypothetical protein
MRPTYALVFLVLAAGFAGVAAFAPGYFVRAAFAYSAGSFVLLAVAYAGAGPGMLLKRPDGRRRWFAWVPFGPYFVLNALTFAAYRTGRAGRTASAVAVAAPNVLFGRRLTTAEARLASPGWHGVLDLAAEFAEVRPLRELPKYRSLPVLDAAAPSLDELRSAADWIIRVSADGPVYVHCALGHNRTGTVVLAYLLAAGRVSDVREGLKYMRALRPGVSLQPPQRRVLEQFVEQLPIRAHRPE